MAAKKGRKSKSLVEKIQEFDPYFVDEVSSFPVDKLKQKVIDLYSHRNAIEVTQKEDVDLLSAKEKVRVINETYSSPLKANKMKLQYLLQLLQGDTDANSGS
jgi:hypothetical protein